MQSLVIPDRILPAFTTSPMRRVRPRQRTGRRPAARQYCGVRDRFTGPPERDRPASTGDHRRGQPGGPGPAARNASAGQGPGGLAARDLPGIRRRRRRAAGDRDLAAGRHQAAERDHYQPVGIASPRRCRAVLGGRGHGRGVRAGHPDRPLVGPLTGVWAGVPGPARPWLRRAGPAVRGGRADAGPGRP